MKENVFPTPPLFVNGSFFKKANIFTLFFADHHFRWAIFISSKQWHFTNKII